MPDSLPEVPKEVTLKVEEPKKEDTIVFPTAVVLEDKVQNEEPKKIEESKKAEPKKATPKVEEATKVQAEQEVNHVELDFQKEVAVLRLVVEYAKKKDLTFAIAKEQFFEQKQIEYTLWLAKEARKVGDYYAKQKDK